MEPIKLNDFTNYTFLSGIEYNSTGTLACFVVHKAELDENNYTSVLWIYDEPQDRLYQLTALGEESSFMWLEDGEHVLFAAKRSKKDKEAAEKGREETVFFKINVRGGEAREAFRIPLKVHKLYELNEGRFLALGTVNLGRASGEEKEKDWEILDEIPYWANGGGFTSLDRTHAFLFDPQTGQLDELTPGALDIQSAALNADKTRAILIGSDYQGKAPQTNSLYVLDLTTRSVEKVPETAPFAYVSAHFVSDDTVLAVGTDMKSYGLNENDRFYRVDIGSGARYLLTPSWDRSLWNSVGSDCRYGRSETMCWHNGYLYFVSTDGADSYLHRINPDGEIERLTREPGSVDGYAVHRDKLLVIAMRGLNLQEVYRVDNGTETRITSFNEWVTQERVLAEVEPLNVETAPGVIIDGWVMRPVGYQAGEKYPAILNIHGGPKTVYGSVFFHEMQYWAAQGYFVFFCNPRGSDGKGNAFADIRGKYGTIDYEDLMSFTDEVLRRYPDIDQERLGVTGGSYGGFMTNWIIGHTQRFRAAASQRSISNWVSMGWTTDIGYFFAPDQIAADPWTDYEKLWEHSPLKYADRVKTPTLFIHSNEDYRCWLPEALQMFSALKYHGVDSRLVMFRGENHELSRSGRPKNRIKRLEEITAWFDRYLKTN